MWHRNFNLNEHGKCARRVLAIAILSAIYALTMAACSTATKPGETKLAETNAASTNGSAPTNSPSPTSASQAANNDLAGTYAVSGAGADGKTYQGEVILTKRDAVYQMSWRLGAESYDGIAVRNGNTMAAAYTTGTNGRGCGAIVYKINSDNSLDGTWGEWGVNSTGTEKAAPIGSVSGSVGAFDVSGTNANGSAYRGKLTVARAENDVYQFAWDTGTKFIGSGVKSGDYLAAGSGAKQCGFVIYQIKGTTLEGKWGVPGSTALGTETATKK